MFHYRKASVLVVVLMTVSCMLMAGHTSYAALVKATAGVPNGTTNFNGIVQWTLNQPGELGSNFEISWDSIANLTGNDIVTTMDFEVDNAFGFTGSVSGNMLTVNNALGNLGTAPGEVDMTWEVDLMGGSLPPLPVLPLLGRPFPDVMPSLSLFIAASDGTSTPVQANGVIAWALILGARAPIQGNLAYDTSMTTADINRLLHERFMAQTLPFGISYAGLNNGFPTFTAENDFNFSVNVSAFSANLTTGVTNSILNPGFDVGFVALGAIPEPTTVMVLLIAMGCLALTFRRREA